MLKKWHNKTNITSLRGTVKNVTIRNMIIDLDFAPVDNYIPQGDMFRYRPLRNVIFIYITKTRLIKYIDNFSTKKKLKIFR